MDIELITLVNSFRNTIALNNLLIKEKILRKLDMIYVLRMYGFSLMNFPQSTSDNIIKKLRIIDKEGDIFKYSRATNGSETNKLLGSILNNALQASCYNIILSNAPINGTTISGNFIQLDSEAIYDTLVQYAPVNAVQSVLQITLDTYLIKMDSDENARALCELLNKKLLVGKTIKVEYIAPLVNFNEKLISELDAIDDIECDIKYNSEKYCINDINSVKNENNVCNDVEKKNYLSLVLNILFKCLQKIQTFIWK